MLPRGVLITSKVDDEVCAKCSGIIINNFVITHGTIILPFLNENVSDLYSTIHSQRITFEVLIQTNFSTRDNELKTDGNRGYNATLESLYEHDYLSKILKQSISIWTYGETKDESKEIVKGLSLFLLLKIEDFCLGFDHDHIKLESEPFQLGMDILVESTPFAATPFFNSWSRGVVSKVLDDRNQLVLIDTRTAVGSEGAPIYLYRNGKQKSLLGMVMCVLIWCQGEFVGLTLGCSILPILQYFKMLQSIPTVRKAKTDLDTLKSAVVLIRSGKMWGSGVVINSAKGILLTCSHIIDDIETPVFVSHKVLQNKRLPARIVYATPKHRPYDLAVLRITPNSGLEELNLSNTIPVKGEEIVSAGYSLLSEHDPMGLGITISRGTISYLDQKGPLHITSSVHGGASGGAILNPPNQLVGIIVCNSKVGDYVLPQFSMGLSVRDFYQPLKRYLETDDPEYLNELTVTDNEDIKKWNFNLSSKL